MDREREEKYRRRLRRSMRWTERERRKIAADMMIDCHS